MATLSLVTLALHSREIAKLAGAVNQLNQPVNRRGYSQDQYKAIIKEATLASGNLIRGREAEDLYAFIDQNVLPMFNDPVRRDMAIRYAFTPTMDPRFLQLETEYEWRYEISQEATLPEYTVQQQIQSFVYKTEQPADRATLWVGEEKVTLKWQYRAERRFFSSGGDLVEEEHLATVQIPIKRGMPTPVRLFRKDRIPVFDSASYTNLYPTKGLKVEVRWRPMELLGNPRLWVFSATKKGSKQYPTNGTCEEGQGYCRWVYEDWLLPGCGFLLTWQALPMK